MTTSRLILLLCLAFLTQNAAEWLGGGPSLPPELAGRLPLPAPRPALAPAALILVSLLVGGALVALARRAGRPRPAAILAAIAGALAANAAGQLAASALLGRLLPGTLAGAVTMLPLALALLRRLARRGPLGRRGTGIAALAGIAASPLLLAAVWAAAALIVPAAG